MALQPSRSASLSSCSSLRRAKATRGGAAAFSILACLATQLSCNKTGPFGHFVGTVKTEWIEPDRKMRLLDDFSYIDPQGTEWKAPKGSVIDGASIPQAFWSIIGSPFTGDYRNASVVHDVACDKRDRPWQQVHLMFYEACRCGGVSEITAKILYAAVYHFGPEWGPNGTIILFDRIGDPQEQFDEMKKFIETRNPSLEEIQRFVAKRPTPR